MNPFIERSRITEPAHFTGRWREVSLVFERIERRRPIMVTGASGVGKSSLITHVAQSATTVMEIPGMRSLFLDLAVLPDAPTCIELIVRALGGQGQTIAALELALAERGNTVLISMDNADSAIAAGWGADLLERLARLARRSVPVYPGGLAPTGAGEFDMLLVTAAGREPPILSEPFATVTLGAIATSEVRLLCEAYLDDTKYLKGQGNPVFSGRRVTLTAHWPADKVGRDERAGGATPAAEGDPFNVRLPTLLLA
ncbi:MAG: hypothetical protein HGA19_08115, partial [Oscillochloris sp.]|nr:hypothetical protein [Oscillochloris sp.]